MGKLKLTSEEPTVHVKGDEFGRSYTPDQCAVACVAALVPVLRSLPHSPLRAECFPQSPALRVLEPCVGGGAFVRAARSVIDLDPTRIDVTGCDFDPAAPGFALCDTRRVGRFEDDTDWSPPRFHCAITNPPFGKAVGQDTTLAIIKKMRRVATIAAALMPWEYATQSGYEELMWSAVAIPVLPRPFPHERGMGLFVWGAEVWCNRALRPLRWRS